MIQGICGLFGSLLNFLYNLFGQNYGFAIIGFTLVINIILLPLTLKQQKSTADMQLIQPELTALQAKYKNDKEKLNAEMMKLYQKHNVNPASGCLPLLIQLPIILILYQVIIKPLSYMLGYTAEQLKELTTLVYGAEHTLFEVAFAVYKTKNCKCNVTGSHKPAQVFAVFENAFSCFLPGNIVVVTIEYKFNCFCNTAVVGNKAERFFYEGS